MTGITASERANEGQPDLSDGSTASLVLDAVAVCAARWGIDKTTVDDVAREAKVSRATVYRLFPGGKDALVELTTERQAVRLVASVADAVDGNDDLESALVAMLSAGASLLAEEPAMAYMRSHEPATLRRFLSFRHLDSILAMVADVLAPTLSDHLDDDQARETVIWGARLVVSYYLSPDPARDLADPAVAHRIVADRVLPGIGLRPADTVGAR